MHRKVTIFRVSSDVMDEIDDSGVGSDVTMIRDVKKHQIVTNILQKNSKIKAFYDLTLKVVYLNKKDKRVTNGQEC